MYGFPFEDVNRAHEEAEAKRIVRELELRMAEERQRIDQAIPPENAASFEELLESVPSNVRERLEHAKVILEMNEIDPADRVSYVADTIELLNYFLNNRSNQWVVTNEFGFRKFLYSVTSAENSWCYPPNIETWMGTDADNVDTKKRVKDTFLQTAKSIRAKWRATEQLIGSVFHPIDPSDITSLRDQLRRTESEALRDREAKEPPEFLAGFHEEIQYTILRNTFAIELTEGCSVRCTFCAFDAAGGVRNTMPFDTMLWILRRVKDRALLYYATDPLDYRVVANGKERTYADVLDAFTILHGTSPFSCTAAPVKSMDVLRRISDRISRLSFSVMNERRLIREGFIERTEGGTYIPKDANIAWRFWNTISYEHNKTPEIYRLKMKKEDKGSTVYDAGRQKFRSHEDGHANGDTVADSIACRDGVVLSPKNAKNSVRMMSTPEYPNGIAEATLTPDHLANGAIHVTELLQQLRDEAVVKIDDLLPYVVVSFSYSTSRPSKRNQTLTETIGFKTFRTDSQNVSEVQGTCEFERVNGKILQLTISQKEMDKPEELAAK